MEAVGLVVVKQEVLGVRNMSHNMEDMFVLNPEDYAAADDAGEIVGIVHTSKDRTSPKRG